jgi:phosphonate transport system ATP-binding protein
VTAGTSSASAAGALDPVIRLDGVTHRYAPGVFGLREVTLTVAPGERVALVGPSGAGKSTLLRVLNGLVTPTDGDAVVLGQSVATLAERARMELRRQVGMIFQEFALIDRLSVLANVLAGRLGSAPLLPSLLGRFPGSDVEAARAALADVGLTGTEDRQVRRLSGGQKQRVGIARALVQQARLILGDEPTANLDVRTADEVLELLVRLGHERGATLVLSLHDVRAARRHCDRIVALKAGSVAWDGPAPSFGEAEVEQVFYGS